MFKYIQFSNSEIGNALCVHSEPLKCECVVEFLLFPNKRLCTVHFGVWKKKKNVFVRYCSLYLKLEMQILNKTENVSGKFNKRFRLFFGLRIFVFLHRYRDISCTKFNRVSLIIYVCK